MEKISKEILDRIKRVVMGVHNMATGYDPDKNLRSEGDLDHIIYESTKIWLRIENNDIALADQKAGAFLMHEIATRHPFVDGNKRTALMCFLIFRYGAVGVKNHFPKSWNNQDDKIINFMLELASYKYTYDDVLKFVKETFK